MITGRLVGDDAVLTWLRRTPDAAASGLARTIAGLGIDLQRRICGGVHSLPLNNELQIYQSGDRIAATVSAGDAYAGARSDIRADLRRRTAAFSRLRPEFNVRGYRQRTDLAVSSFMVSVLEDMEPEIRDQVEAALRAALTR